MPFFVAALGRQEWGSHFSDRRCIPLSLPTITCFDECSSVSRDVIFHSLQADLQGDSTYVFMLFSIRNHYSIIQSNDFAVTCCYVPSETEYEKIADWFELL